MKIKPVTVVLVSLSLLAGSLFAQSQQATKSTAKTPVTQEELTKYATAMDSVNEMTETLKKTITEMVNNSGTVSADRFNELSGVVNDEAKLTAANATPEEIAFVKEVVAKKDEETAKINQTFQSLAKEYVGAATFNKVKKALNTDPDLKARYDELMNELSQDNQQH